MSERQKELEFREDQSNKYLQSRDETNTWLGEMEQRLERLEPVAIDVERIEQQIDTLRVRVWFKRFKGTCNVHVAYMYM